jgi:hypothetical protein
MHGMLLACMKGEHATAGLYPIRPLCEHPMMKALQPLRLLSNAQLQEQNSLEALKTPAIAKRGPTTSCHFGLPRCRLPRA